MHRRISLEGGRQTLVVEGLENFRHCWVRRFSGLEPNSPTLSTDPSRLRSML